MIGAIWLAKKVGEIPEIRYLFKKNEIPDIKKE
jgi:hypothetical protein